MPGKILGLDISTNTVKALLLESKGRFGGRILAAQTVNINDCGGREAALKKLTENNLFVHASCIISLPLTDIMFRQVSLPFREEGKIRKTLPLELEPLLPFAPDEIVTDYLATPAAGLLVAVATKKNVREWIKLGEDQWREVPVLDVSSVPIASLLPDHMSAAAAGMIVDIGADSTAAIFYEDGSIVQVRALAFGGDQITAALAEDLSINKAEAEQIKVNGKDGEVGAKTAVVCRRFCAELKNTLEFLELNKTLKNYPAKILLTGGGSLFRPLQNELGNYFSMPVELLDLCRARQIEIAQSGKNEYQPQIMNAALANALCFSAGVRSFNFRRGEFKMKAAFGNFRGQWKKAALIAGIIFVMAAINQYLDYNLEARRLDNIKKQISVIFKKNYPEGATMVDPLQQLKTKLNESKKTFSYYEKGSETTVLDLFKDISALILPALDILITHFSLESNMILLKGEAKNVDAVTAAKNELMKSKYFKEVAIGSTSLAGKGSKVEFDLRITLK